MVNFFYKRLPNRGYGIYVKSISGIALYILGFKLPEVSWDDKSLATDITTHQRVKNGAVRVTSSRLYIKPTEESAKTKVDKLNKLPDEQAAALVMKLNFKAIEKHYHAVKMQYFQVHAEMFGQDVMQMTTQDKDKAEKLAYSYGKRGLDSKLVKTVARTKVVPASKYAKVVATAELVPAKAPGLVGMTQPIKDQTKTFGRRLIQRRKRTTQVSFWNRNK